MEDIPPPCVSPSLAKMPVCGGNTAVVDRLFYDAARDGKAGDGLALLRQEEAIMPDGGRAIDACYINHWRIVVVARPHTHYVIAGIANRPVVAEIGRGSRFRGGWANRAGIALVTLLLCAAMQVERATFAKLEGARGVVAQDVCHHKGGLL